MSFTWRAISSGTGKREEREEEEQRQESRRGKGGDERVEKGKGEEKLAESFFTKKVHSTVCV